MLHLKTSIRNPWSLMAIAFVALGILSPSGAAEVAHWHFNETAGPVFDSSGSGFNGAPQGNLLQGVPTPQGSGVYLDGVDDYIKLPIALLGNGLPVGILEARIKLDDYPPAGSLPYTLFNRGTAEKHTSINIAVDDMGHVGAHINRTPAPSSTSAVPLGVFTSIAVTWDETRITYFIDGALGGSFAFAASPPPNDTCPQPMDRDCSNSIEIGRDDQDLSFFRGTIDELRIADTPTPTLCGRSNLLLLAAVTAPGNNPAHNGPVLRFSFFEGNRCSITQLPAISQTVAGDPGGVVVDPFGNIYVGNRHGNVGGGKGSIGIFRADGCGGCSDFDTITGNGLEAVHGVAISPWGELFALNHLRSTISRFRFDAQGRPYANPKQPTISLTGHVPLTGLAFSPGGDLYVTSSNTLLRLKFDAEQVSLPVVTFRPTAFSELAHLEFSPAGDELFVADRSGGVVHRIRFDLNGDPLFGTTPSIPVPAAYGVAVSPGGELFVSRHPTGGIDRFGFDAAGAAVPLGQILTPPHSLGDLAIADLRNLPPCDPPDAVPCSVARSGLKIFRDGLWRDVSACGSDVDPTLPTAVIVHGWNIPEDACPPLVKFGSWDGLNCRQDLDICGTNMKDAEHFSLRIAAAIQERVGAVNILAWDWLLESTHRLAVASSRVSGQALALAGSLRRVFPVQYAKPIHFLGHSLGAYLAAECASDLLRTQSISGVATQVTLWDPPSHWVAATNGVCLLPLLLPPPWNWIGTGSCLEFIEACAPDLVLQTRFLGETVKTIRTAGAYVEVYDGFTNVSDHGANLVVHACEATHSVYDWYAKTIPATGLHPCYVTSRNGSCESSTTDTIGFSNSVLLQDVASIRRPSIPGCDTRTVELSAREFGCGDCSQEVFWPGFGCRVRKALIGGVTAVIDFTLGTVTAGCSLCSITSASVVLETSTSIAAGGEDPADDDASYLSGEFEVDEKHAFVSFSYGPFDAPGPSTFRVTVSVEDEQGVAFLPLLETPFVPALHESSVDSGHLDLRRFLGRFIRLVFSLESSSSGARIEVRDLKLWESDPAPVADAGEDQQVPLKVGRTWAAVFLDGSHSSDVEHDELRFEWKVDGVTVSREVRTQVFLAKGEHQAILLVRDPADNVAFDSVEIEVFPDRPFKRGDASGDGKRNISDALLMLISLFADPGQRLPCEDVADVDDSGTLEVSDPILLLNFLFLGVPVELKPPYPDCGYDPSIDKLRCNEYTACQ